LLSNFYDPMIKIIGLTIKFSVWRLEVKQRTTVFSRLRKERAGSATEFVGRTLPASGATIAAGGLCSGYAWMK